MLHILILQVFFLQKFSSSAPIRPQFDKQLNIFSDCLIYWRQFHSDSESPSMEYTVFQALQPSIYPESPYIFELGHNYNQTFFKTIRLTKLKQVPAQLTKYLSCQIKFQEIQLEKLVPTLKQSGESDTSFVIYFSNDHYSLQLASFLQNNLHRLNNTGIPLFLDNAGNLRLVCLISPCSPESSQLSTLSQIKLHWNTLHKNLQGYTLVTVTHGNEKVQCDPLLPEQSRIRVNCLISSFLNASLSVRSGIADQPDMAYGIAVSPALTILLKHFRTTWIRYQFSVPGFAQDPFAFVITTSETHHNNLHALTQPFQQSVWISIIVAMVIMPLALMLVTAKSPQKMKLTTYFNWSFVTLASMLDQCNDQVLHLFTSSHSSALWILWNFFSLLILNSYDGQLYSFLASEHNPVTPNSFPELALKDLPVFTISTTVQKRNFTNVGVSVLERLLKPPQLHIDNQTMGNKSAVEFLRERNKQLQKGFVQLPWYYQKLVSRLHFVSMLHKGGFGRNLKQIVNTAKTLDEPTFAFVDTEFHVKIFAASLGLSKTVKVLKVQRVPNFASCHGWIVRKFFLYDKIEHVLWQVRENGLAEFWNVNHQLYAKLKIMKAFLNSTNELSRARNVAGYLLSRINGGEQQPEEIFQPMTFELLDGFIKLTLSMLAGAAVCVLMEIVYFIMTARMNNNNQGKFLQEIPGRIY